MSHLTTVPLRAFELARYSIGVACYVCDADNRVDQPFCTQCHAPLSLHSQDKKHSSPRLVTVLGAPGVGKTCYLGMLTDMLSRNTSEIQLFARGAFSVSLQQETLSALARHQFPAPTPVEASGWQWVHGAVHSKKTKQPVELIVPDISGAAMLGEVDLPKTIPAVRRLLKNSVGAVIMLDAAALANGVQESEFAALKILGDLMSSPLERKEVPWSARPIAFVLAKCDRCDWAFDAAEEFVRRHAPGLYRQACEQHRRHRFFAVSIASSTTAIDAYGERLNVPLRIEPRGVVEPFSWLMCQLKSRR